MWDALVTEDVTAIDDNVPAAVPERAIAEDQVGHGGDATAEGQGALAAGANSHRHGMCLPASRRHGHLADAVITDERSSFVIIGGDQLSATDGGRAGGAADFTDDECATDMSAAGHHQLPGEPEVLPTISS